MKQPVEEADIELIEAARAGNAEAFTHLVQRYKNYVYQTAFGILNNRMDAEDVAQEAFITAYKSLSQLREAVAFPSWLATTTTRLALTVLKRQKTLRDVVSSEEKSLAGKPDVEVERVHDKLLLEQLFDQLNEESRVVLTLRELNARSYQEIADMLDIPVGTVRSRLHHARMRLQELLKNSREGDDGR